MSVTRANVEFAKRIFNDRLGDPYVYGGNWDPMNVRTGTDCSGLVGDCLDAVNLGTAMPWRRSVSTESWGYDYGNNRPVAPGTPGPKGTVAVASLADVPADAVVIVNIHHGGGGASSHTQCVVDGIVMESNGSHGTCTRPGGAMDPHSDYWTDHWVYDGPIVEDGTPAVVIEPPDTLYADVSEWQTPVTDAYPYRVLCIRSNDGNHRDVDWANNHAWCRGAADAGRLAFFIVYFVYRPGVDSVAVLKSLVGEPHPKMAVMVDVESWGGQIGGNQSAGINAAVDDLAAWLGDRRRVIGYGNVGDLNNLWPRKPDGMRLVIAGYGANPSYPGKIAHQYTNGEGYGARDGLPDGAPPWQKCDMNSADGLTATEFAAALGITTSPHNTPAPDLDPLEELLMSDLRAPSLSIYAIPGEQPPLLIDMIRALDAHGPHEPFIEGQARGGDPDAIARVINTAQGLGPYGTAPTAVWQATAVLTQIEATHPEWLTSYLAQKG